MAKRQLFGNGFARRCLFDFSRFSHLLAGRGMLDGLGDTGFGLFVVFLVGSGAVSRKCQHQAYTADTKASGQKRKTRLKKGHSASGWVTGTKQNSFAVYTKTKNYAISKTCKTLFM
jgi:hypothetical protein